MNGNGVSRVVVVEPTERCSETRPAHWLYRPDYLAWLAEHPGRICCNDKDCRELHQTRAAPRAVNYNAPRDRGLPL